MESPQEQNKIISDQRTHLRDISRQIRSEISPKRRQEAEEQSLSQLISLFNEHRKVMSYASFGHEFSTEKMNQYLEKNHKLILPKMENNELIPYHVTNLSTQLSKHPLGFYEPIPKQCEKISKDQLTCVLVPGLAFDADFHRLGYGKGHYDKFLSTLSNKAKCYGLGFKEQYRKELIPTLTTDHPLNGLYLF